MHEKENKEESIRIGVFVCHCGSNIGGVLDCKALAEFAQSLPDVEYAEDNLYTCSEPGLASIKDAIKEYDLNRIVVASCTPRTHENLFQKTIKEAGINPYLFELVNIREQCSWVHTMEPEKGMDKARDLIAMNVSKVKLLEPIYETTVDVTNSALIIGGGIAGLTASLSLSRQGFDSFIVEREEELGGLVKNIHYVLGNANPQDYLNKIIKEVGTNRRIRIFTNAKLKELNGFIGNFSATIIQNKQEEEIKVGAVIVATGGREYKPTEYLYGKNDRVLTQLELERKIVSNELKARTITMIQCVGSRNEERPNCSRVCCSQAIKNALKLKEISPKINVCIIYRDIQVTGHNEIFYSDARQKGVIFIRYDESYEPRVGTKDNKLLVKVKDTLLGEIIKIETDLVVLSTAFLPSENKELSQILKVPLDKNGFFLEAHVKLRPLDFATDGVFLCGAAQWPKFIDETITQALGTAARASTILSKDKLKIVGAIAEIDENVCNGCGNCRDSCPYNAIEILQTHTEFKALRDLPDPLFSFTRYKSKILPAVCKGCGVCVDVCPVGALSLKHFTFEQLLAMNESLLNH